MFYPLYPVGIGAEWWLMYLTIEPGRRISKVYSGVIYFLLALYFFGKQFANEGMLKELTASRCVQNVYVYD